MQSTRPVARPVARPIAKLLAFTNGANSANLRFAKICKDLYRMQSTRPVARLLVWFKSGSKRIVRIALGLVGKGVKPFPVYLLLRNTSFYII